MKKIECTMWYTPFLWITGFGQYFVSLLNLNSMKTHRIKKNIFYLKVSLFKINN